MKSSFLSLCSNLVVPKNIDPENDVTYTGLLQSSGISSILNFREDRNIIFHPIDQEESKKAFELDIAEHPLSISQLSQAKETLKLRSQPYSESSSSSSSSSAKHSHQNGIDGASHHSSKMKQNDDERIFPFVDNKQKMEILETKSVKASGGNKILQKKSSLEKMQDNDHHDSNKKRSRSPSPERNDVSGSSSSAGARNPHSPSPIRGQPTKIQHR